MVRGPNERYDMAQGNPSLPINILAAANVTDDSDRGEKVLRIHADFLLLSVSASTTIILTSFPRLSVASPDMTARLVYVEESLKGFLFCFCQGA